MPLPPFERAAADGDYARVRAIMDQTSLSQRDYDEALIYAAMMGHYEIVRALFGYGHASYRDYHGFKMAAYEGHLPVVEYFYGRVTIPGLVLSQSLELAASHGHFPVVQFLLDSGADVHYDDDNALRSAVRGGHLSVSEFLLENDANVDAEDGFPLIYASEDGNHDLVILLIDHGANVDIRDGAALFGAIQENHLDIVDLLVSDGATITEEMLEVARESGYEEILDYLEEHAEPLSPNELFIRAVLQSEPTPRPLMEGDDSLDAITTEPIAVGEEYVLCSNQIKAHAYALTSIQGWCGMNNDCTKCPVCRLPMTPQRFIKERSGYSMTRRRR